jgi:hypothetical protein
MDPIRVGSTNYCELVQIPQFRMVLRQPALAFAGIAKLSPRALYHRPCQWQSTTAGEIAASATGSIYLRIVLVTMGPF